MSPQDFETKFSEVAKPAWTWAEGHWTFTVPLAAFIVGFLVGKFF